MLVISRRVGESVIIGDDIEIKITRSDERGVIRMSIDAPRSVPIFRRELFDAIKAGGQTPLPPDQRPRESR
jgi:carbon storage regulator